VHQLVKNFDNYHARYVCENYEFNYLLKRLQHLIGAVIKTRIVSGYSTGVNKRVGVGRRRRTKRFYQCTSLPVTAVQAASVV
jgi:hypothetical protein